MARLPDIYDVRPTPRPAVGVASFDGMAVPRALGEAANTLTAIGEEYNKEQTIQDVLAARRKMDDWERKAREDAQQVRGKDAFMLPEQIGKAFDDQAAQIAATLGSKRARLTFAEMAVSRRGQVTDWASGHAAKQREEVRIGEYKANTDSFIKNAADDPARAPTELGFLRDTVRDYWKGMSAAEVNAKVSEATDVLHTSVVKSLLAGDNAVEANKYFEGVKGSMSSTARAALNQDVKRVNDAIEATSYVKDLWDKMGPKSPNDPIKLSDMETAAREKYATNPGKAKEVLSQLGQKAVAFNQQQREVNTAAVNSIMDAYASKVPVAKIQLMDAWKALPGAEREKMLEHFDNRQYQLLMRAQASDQRAVAAADRKERELEQASNSDYLYYRDHGVLAAMSVDEVRALQYKLGARRTGQLMELRQALESKQNALLVKMDEDTFKKLATDAGYDAYPKSEGKRKELGGLRDAVDQKIAAFQAAEKRVASYDEKRAIMQRELDNKVMVDRALIWDAEKPYFMLTPDEQKKAYVTVNGRDVYVNTIPPAELVKIQRALQVEGKPVTQKSIVEKWMLMGNKPAGAKRAE